MLERAELRGIKRRGLVTLPAEQRPDPSRDPGADLLPKIKHIVVLMMENHSFDNYLGTLGRGEGLPKNEAGEPAAVNKLSDGREFTSYHQNDTGQIAGNPTQTWNASHIANADGNCGGFAEAVFKTVQPGADGVLPDPRVPMRYWTESDLPFYHGLAKVFPLADHWFCSCLGPTFPNRRFLISGTAHGLIDDLPWDLVDYPPAGTIFDALTRHGIDWVNYHNVHPVRVLLSRLLGGPGLVVLRKIWSVGRWLPAVTNAVRGNKSFTADLYPLGFIGSIRHLRSTPRFFDDALRGNLPPVSVVDPDFGLYSEENPQDIAQGEAFAAAVIDAVMKGPDWESTLLIWTYDEHGGYYDHMAPPETVAPDNVPARNWQLSHQWVRTLLRLVAPKLLTELLNADDGPVTYDRYGFRVPAVIVSPYARENCVLDTTFDHTSILKLIEEKWNLPPLTHRDAAATSPVGALDLDAPPAFLTPPRLPPAKLGGFHYQAKRRGTLRIFRRS